MDETESSLSASSDTLSSRTDIVVAALANHRRRATLASLWQTQSGTATVEELASAIIEHEDEQSSIPRHTMSLHHVHLPKLADANLITYDPNRGRVSDQSDDWVVDLHATIEDG